MALSTVQSNNKLIKFLDRFTVEWARENLFSPYQGAEMTNIIRTIRETATGGEQINIPMLGKLRGVGVGSGTLVGNEENLDDYGMRAWVDWARNAVKMKKNEKHKQSADAFAEAKPLLSTWADELRRDETIEAFMALPSTSAPVALGSDAGDRVNGLRFGAASTTAANRNTWVSNNSDRVLFGNTVANYNATFATALANVDATNDLFTAASSKLMKRVAKTAVPSIKPYKVTDGREYYVCFHGSNTFYDLQTSLDTVNKDARAREGRGMDNNPLFQDGDELYRGVIHVEIPEIDLWTTDVGATLTTGGAGSVRANPVLLCGQSALAMIVGQMPKPTFLKEDDYGFVEGVGIEMAYGLAKLFKAYPNSGTVYKQAGVVTGFFASQTGGLS